ncbi:hypothetical protein DCC81_05795 [Chitinophaga parva]|uniref:Uncharacterized protein n=1 Tax=Chitinophaga parva TaxID=2169414 RepID=A0A2T7BMT3_9BACT|nr:hypothetical protein DCC81_05795 [Chitinophaga parva]
MPYLYPEADMAKVAQQGRHRYDALAHPVVAYVLESLGSLANWARGCWRNGCINNSSAVCSFQGNW